ncbi:MAG TPA: TldD/PmbA family protein [Bacillota bacterium]|nr:TldD/PmbA family protein [Bacillota bacterium]
MRVDGYQKIIDLCRKLGAEHQLYFIARIQSKKELSVHINNGKTEEISTGSLEGIGIQVFNPRGYMGFAAGDQVTEEIVTDLFAKAALLSEQGELYQSEPNQEIFKVSPLEKRIEIPLKYPYGSLDLTAIETKLKDLNRQLLAQSPQLAVRTFFRLTDEEWRIIRTDGTDVIFTTPRSFIFHSITAKSAAGAAISATGIASNAATTSTNLPGSDLGIIIEPASLERLQARAKKAANLALNLLDAPQIASGHYKLVIDYGLAKGLGHEAFGHAAETDNLESSILGEGGRFKKGMSVASTKLSIIDGPVVGDYAYQPVSAVGIERKTVPIVEHGILQNGLSDVFSAARAGVTLTGAERVESVFQLPIARMSNIRIQFEDPIPVDQDFESITAADLYQILLRNQLMKPDETVLYLTGFQGGQVNPAFGDFVFQCSGIYRLAEVPILYKPAIFSGKILSVLKSVSQAIGPLQFDAMGTCGKMGQSVPSCGGSHYFLIIDQNPEVFIGGE